MKLSMVKFATKREKRESQLQRKSKKRLQEKIQRVKRVQSLRKVKAQLIKRKSILKIKLEWIYKYIYYSVVINRS